MEDNELKLIPWSHKEINVLYELYPSAPMEKIQQKINRSVEAIYGKAQQLKIKRKVPPTWTYEDDLLLCQLRKENYSMSEIGDIMGRSKYSISGRLSSKGYTLHPLQGV